VAGVTKFRLPSREKKLRRRRMVNRVAVGANHIGPRVLGRPNVRARYVLRMALETRGLNLRRVQMRKSARKWFHSARFRVLRSRPVAPFAARFIRRFLPRSNRFEMGIPKKSLRYFRMAVRANLAPGEPASRGRGE